MSTSLFFFFSVPHTAACLQPPAQCHIQVGDTNEPLVLLLFYYYYYRFYKDGLWKLSFHCSLLFSEDLMYIQSKQYGAYWLVLWFGGSVLVLTSESEMPRGGHAVWMSITTPWEWVREDDRWIGMSCLLPTSTAQNVGEGKSVRTRVIVKCMCSQNKTFRPESENVLETS